MDKIQYSFLRDETETEKLHVRDLSTCELIREITGIRNLNILNNLKEEIEIYASDENKINADKEEARKIEASLELGKRYNKNIGKKAVKIRTAEDVLNIIGYEYRFSEQENLIILCLNGANEVIGFNVVSRGTVNQTSIHPREVFKNAIKQNAVSIIMVHNHPSGNLEPSQADINGTRTIKEAGRILGIQLLDHLIVGTTDGYESVKFE